MKRDGKYADFFSTRSFLLHRIYYSAEFRMEIVDEKKKNKIFEKKKRKHIINGTASATAPTEMSSIEWRKQWKKKKSY